MLRSATAYLHRTSRSNIGLWIIPLEVSSSARSGSSWASRIAGAMISWDTRSKLILDPSGLNLTPNGMRTKQSGTLMIHFLYRWQVLITEPRQRTSRVDVTEWIFQQ